MNDLENEIIVLKDEISDLKKERKEIMDDLTISEKELTDNKHHLQNFVDESDSLNSKWQELLKFYDD